ncbi:MAG: response regulator [bacterium]
MLENIIIADDSSTARMIIKRCLEIAGAVDANFLEAANGEEALQLAKEHSVDLIVTDLNMPIMDGRALIRHVKTSPKLTHLPILVISSAGNDAVRQDLLRQGATAVIDKPVSPAALASVFQDISNDTEWG